MRSFALSLAILAIASGSSAQSQPDRSERSSKGDVIGPEDRTNITGNVFAAASGRHRPPR